MSRVEQPEYTLIESHGPIELRDYPALILAETEVPGERGEAIRAGFRVLADYIFGHNLPRSGIAIGATPAGRTGERIAMTAPVWQQAAGAGWRVRFGMPARRALDTLPMPINPAVRLIELPASRVAAIRFSGRPRPSRLAERERSLMTFVEARALPVLAGPLYAFYDPPWTLPWFRRNEILVGIAR